jgi:glycosyltransferase involved in cell wall biosynthesis
MMSADENPTMDGSMLPLVSVIIPCFRQAHFLGAALRSVLSQSYANIQPIVVNDGSDDDTDQVVMRFGDRICYLKQCNKGLPAARNTGIANAEGMYLLFLDADDCLHPDAISCLVEAARGREEVLCVMGNRCFEHDGDFESPTVQMPPCVLPLGPQLLQRNFGPPHCYLSSRLMVLRCGCFDTNIKLYGCEDWDLWLRLLFDGAQITPVYKAGAYYRQHSISMSKNVARMEQSRAEVFRRNIRRLADSQDVFFPIGIDRNSSLLQVRQQLTVALLEAAYALRQKGCYFSAMKHYCLSLLEGELNAGAFKGLFKLFPHWALRGFLVSNSL